jgi:hypothetical protein
MLCCNCSQPLMAHRVESLRCEGSEAIGAKWTCRERRERVDPTKMTISDIGCALRRCRFQPLSKCSFEPLQCYPLSLGADMRRREFISLLGDAASAWATYTHAQQPAMPVIGFLSTTTREGWTEHLRGFRQGLKDTGYVEGENVAIEYRWAETAETA